MGLCSSTADCESVPYKPVCKETRPGGSKLCQSPLSCSQDCLPTQFCTVRGTCKERHREKVACKTTYECSGDEVCKEMVDEGDKMCQPSPACAAYCSYYEYCSHQNTCETPWIDPDLTTSPDD